MTFAADIIATQASGTACSPVNVVFVDDGYNLDTTEAVSPRTRRRPESEWAQRGRIIHLWRGARRLSRRRARQQWEGRHNGRTAKQPGPIDNLGETRRSMLYRGHLTCPPRSTACPQRARCLTTVASSPRLGANCAIGAYLLQATNTVLGTPTAVGQNTSVTYTATVTPAPDGGTISFDDGDGNPASANCAARSLSQGTATCAVSYAKLGELSRHRHLLR